MTVYVVLVDDVKPRDDSSDQTTSFFPFLNPKNLHTKNFSIFSCLS